MPQTHGRTDENGTRIWLTERLWELARELPVHSVPIDSIRELDQNCWFHDASPPTCRNVARHVQRIQQADLSYPIILSADGGLMDGGHRLCKAWLMGHTEIRAVRFVTDPEPDEVRTTAPRPKLPNSTDTGEHFS